MSREAAYPFDPGGAGSGDCGYIETLHYVYYVQAPEFTADNLLGVVVRNYFDSTLATLPLTNGEEVIVVAD